MKRITYGKYNQSDSQNEYSNFSTTNKHERLQSGFGSLLYTSNNSLTDINNYVRELSNIRG